MSPTAAGPDTRAAILEQAQFLIRTRGRPWRDAPNPWLAISTLGALAAALVIPFSPLGGWFGFSPPGALLTVSLAGIVLAYLVAAELLKPLAIAGRALKPPSASAEPARLRPLRSAIRGRP